MLLRLLSSFHLLLYIAFSGTCTIHSIKFIDMTDIKQKNVEYVNMLWELFNYSAGSALSTFFHALTLTLCYKLCYLQLSVMPDSMDNKAKPLFMSSGKMIFSLQHLMSTLDFSVYVMSTISIVSLITICLCRLWSEIWPTGMCNVHHTLLCCACDLTIPICGCCFENKNSSCHTILNRLPWTLVHRISCTVCRCSPTCREWQRYGQGYTPDNL